MDSFNTNVKNTLLLMDKAENTIQIQQKTNKLDVCCSKQTKHIEILSKRRTQIQA